MKLGLITILTLSAGMAFAVKPAGEIKGSEGKDKIVDPRDREARERAEKAAGGVAEQAGRVGETVRNDSPVSEGIAYLKRVAAKATRTASKNAETYKVAGGIAKAAESPEASERVKDIAKTFSELIQKKIDEKVKDPIEAAFQQLVKEKGLTEKEVREACKEG